MTQLNGQLSSVAHWFLDFQLNDGLATGSLWYDFSAAPDAAVGAAHATIFHAPGSPPSGPIQNCQPTAVTSFENNVTIINTDAADFGNPPEVILVRPTNLFTLNAGATTGGSGPLAHASSSDLTDGSSPDLNTGSMSLQVTSSALIATNSTTFTSGTATATSASDLNTLIKAADLASSGTFTINISGSLALNTLPAVANGESITIINNVATVTKLSAVPDINAINLHSGVSLIFNGTNSAILDGGSTVRGLFAYAGNVTVNNLTIQNTLAQGGAGAGAGFAGGGGAGLGGGLFVASAANVTLNSVSFSNNKAIGGAGGNNLGGATEVWGGGGGLGGNGGATFGGIYFSGGGGVGRTAFGGTGSNNGRAVANGGDGTNVPGPGIIVGGAHAGNGAFLVSTDPHTTGAIYGGGGGIAEGTGHNASFPTPQHYYGAGSGGGGVGGHSGYSKSTGYNSKNTGGGGGVGGFGGGGGAGYYYGGNGGFGGGGGAGQYSYGGSGGFGGGGGGLPNKAGTLAQGGFGAGKAGGGYGIGNGKTPQYKLSGGDSGGGGLGAGGAVFVQSGGVLTLGGAGTVAAGTVAGGAGGTPTGTNGNGAGTAGTAGSGFGSGIFIQNNSTTTAQGVTFAPAIGQLLTVSGVIADEEGQGGSGANATAGSLSIKGGGTVRLTGANTFAGGSTISAGSTLDLGASGAGGAAAVFFASGSLDRLLVENVALSSGHLSNTVSAFVAGDVIDLSGLTFKAGASASIVSNTLSVVSNGVTDTVTLGGQGANLGVVAVQDSGSGTEVIATNFTISTEAQLLADLAIVNSGGVGAASGVNYTFTFLNGVSLVAGGESVNLLSGSSLTLAGTFVAGSTVDVTSGTLIAGNIGALGAGGISIGASGTVSLAGFAQTIGDLSGSGAVLTQGATLTEGTAGSTSFSGSITGTGSAKLIKQGAGTLTLSGTDTLPGGLTINAGGVNLNASTALNGGGSIAFGAGTGDVLEFHLTSVPTNVIAGFVPGQTLDLNMSGTTVTGASIVNTNTLQVTLSAGGPINLTMNPGQSWIGSSFGHSTGGSDNFITENRFTPVLTAGGTVSFTGGGAAVTADSGLTIVDNSSTTLASAKVVIGGFITGDTLTVGTPGGLTTAFGNGTLTLTGVASLATYQNALDSVAYGFAANGDPTVGGTHTTRTLSWSVNDGTLGSNTGTSSVNTVHAAPTVVAGGTVSYDGGAPAVVLDAGLTVTDPDSGGNLAGATITISSGFHAGDTLNFANQNGIAGSFNAGTLTLSGTASVAQYRTALESVTYSFSGADPSIGHTDTSRVISWVVSDGMIASNTGTSTLNVTCYRRGTRILTDRGEVPVEDLRIGDLVVTLSGIARPIRWIGGRHIDLARHPAPDQVRPILIRAGAVADGMPRRDLYVSPDHAILLDGALILARQLVNGASIERLDDCLNVTYYHVELETHDILMAEGLPAESYLDTGNRGMFENGGVPLVLHPLFDDGQQQRVAGSCAPFAHDATLAESIWRRLAVRGERLGFGASGANETTSDPDLHVVVGERVIRPVCLEEGRYSFVLPPAEGASVRSARLVSRSAVACEARPWIDDRRCLGVPVSRMTLRRGAEVGPIPLDHPGASRGWHEVDGDDGAIWRWTDGNAEIPISVWEAVVLEVVLAACPHYLVRASGLPGANLSLLARAA